MVRSAEAIRKRAQKRNRTEEEQRRIDGQDTKKKRLEEPSQREEAEQAHPALQEAGAWKCHGCGNHNFASRHSCHSKTCHEVRPTGTFVPPPWKPSRHDPSTSKKLVWAPLASKEQIVRNHELRNTYLETGGEGMSEDDVKRAKVLIARDERKIQKKSISAVNSTQSEFIENSSNKSEFFQKPNENNSESIEKPKELKKAHVDLKKQNGELRNMYLETGGEGMSEDDVKRAKILIARDERKIQKKSISAAKSTQSEFIEKPNENNNESVEKPKEGKKAHMDQKKQNGELRKLYRKCYGEGMTEEDVTRAKILIARDERKALKKRAAPAHSSTEKCGESETVDVEHKKEISEADTKSMEETPQKELKKQDLALRKLYLKQGGEGMSEEDVAKAKILVAKAEQKKRKKELKVKESAQ